MAVGAAILVALSVLFEESIVLPERGATWLALAYLVVLGSGPVFVLYVVVVRLWGAARAAYTFVLIPLVTVLLSAWIDDEPIGAGLVLGGLLVLAGVYVGALRPATPPTPPPSGDRPRPRPSPSRHTPRRGSGVATGVDRARARADREGLVHPQRARCAVVRARRARFLLRVRGSRGARAGLLAAGDQHPGAAAGRADVDVPLGGRPGGLPRRRRRGARDRRGRRTAPSPVGSPALSTRDEARDRRSRADAVHGRRGRRARPLDRERRSARAGAATPSTKPRAATAPASTKTRRCRRRRTRSSCPQRSRPTPTVCCPRARPATPRCGARRARSPLWG